MAPVESGVSPDHKGLEDIIVGAGAARVCRVHGARVLALGERRRV